MVFYDVSGGFEEIACFSENMCVLRAASCLVFKVYVYKSLVLKAKKRLKSVVITWYIYYPTLIRSLF